MPFKTFVVKVHQWDFRTDEGIYIPSPRELGYLNRPFVVQAYDDVDAMNKVSDRTGWNIVDCEIESI